MKKILFIILFLIISTSVNAKDFCKRFPTDTAIECYTPSNPPPGGGANPAGTGSELQARLNATTFQALTGSSVSGGNLNLQGILDMGQNAINNASGLSMSSGAGITNVSYLNFDGSGGGLSGMGDSYFNTGATLSMEGGNIQNVNQLYTINNNFLDDGSGNGGIAVNFDVGGIATAADFEASNLVSGYDIIASHNVTGIELIGSPRINRTSVSASGNPANADSYYEIDASGGNKTITLFNTSSYGNGKIFILKKIDSSTNTVTIAFSSGQTVDGSSTYVLSSQNQTVTLLADDTSSTWRLIGNYVSVSNSDGTLTISPTIGSVVASLAKFYKAMGVTTLLTNYGGL